MIKKSKKILFTVLLIASDGFGCWPGIADEDRKAGRNFEGVFFRSGRKGL